MCDTILPEVKQRQAEEEARKQEERRKIAEALVAGKREGGRGQGLEGGVGVGGGEHVCVACVCM